MRLAAFTALLLPALAASHVMMARPAGPPATALLPTATPTNAPATIGIAPSPPAPTVDVNLELREIIKGLPATIGPLDAPVVSTEWLETTIKGVITWVPVVYTQTFAEFPDQLPTAVAKGEIGMGTLTGAVGVAKTAEAGAMATAAAGWMRHVVAAGMVVAGLMV